MPKTVQLPDNTVIPSPGLGCMGMSFAYGATNDEQRKATLRKAMKIGNTFWNTANAYGRGLNEKIIGEVLREGNNREKVLLVSKWGYRFRGDDPAAWDSYVDGSAAHCAEAFEQSVKDLGGIYPDTYLLHRVDPNTPIEESVRAMDALRQAGKIKHIGLSECSADTLRRAAAIAPISFVEVEYSPWTLVMETNGVLDACKELGVVMIAYSPLGRGFLTGRYKTVADFQKEGDFRAYMPRTSAETFDKNYRIVVEFEKLAAKKGCTPSQLVLGWVMAQADNIVPIPGTRSEKYLLENFSSRDIVLTPDEVAEIRRVCVEFAPEGKRYAAKVDTTEEFKQRQAEQEEGQVEA
ncbi:hypothetical protein JCM8097_006591 [Rhodosporidiobolus ruineniae]